MSPSEPADGAPALVTALPPTPAERRHNLGLTASPRETMAAAREVADVLGSVIAERGLYVELSYTNRRTGEVKVSRHITLEGWTTLGMLCGPILGDAVVADIEWVKPALGGRGWEARAVARTGSGAVLATAESMVSRHDETKWANAPEHQVRSMAQTRAASKALRLALGWIVALTDYATTPAEEMGEPEPAPPRPEADDLAADYRDEVTGLIARMFPNLANADYPAALGVILNAPAFQGASWLDEWMRLGGSWRDILKAVSAFKTRLDNGEDAGAAARSLDAFGVLRQWRGPS